MRPRRVLYLEPSGLVTGGAIALLRLVQAMDRRRFRPLVVLGSDGPLAVRFRKVPGFISYIAIDEGDGWWASLSLFETREGIIQSDRAAAEWVKANAPGLVSGPPEITAGPVVVK